MKRTQRSNLPQRKLRLAAETIRKLALVDLTRVNGGSDDTSDTSIDASRVGPCTNEKTICGVCHIS